MDIREWRGDERLAHEEPVASLLRAAAAPTEPGPQPGEEAALAAFRATHQTIGRTPMRSTKMKAAFAAAVSAGVLLTGGIAAAATGALPGAAHLGLSHHDNAAGGENANEHSDTRGVSEDHAGQPDATDQSTESTDTGNESTEDQQKATSEDTTTTTDESTDGENAAAEHPDNHGGAVSEAAKSDYPSGREHGAAVSSTARSDAGKKEHETSGKSADHKPTDPSATGKTASEAKGDNGKQGTDGADDGADTEDTPAPQGAQGESQAGD